MSDRVPSKSKMTTLACSAVTPGRTVSITRLELVLRRSDALQAQVDFGLAAVMSGVGKTTPERLKFGAPLCVLLQIRICHLLQTVNAVIVGVGQILDGGRFGVVRRLADRVFCADGGRAVAAVSGGDMIHLAAEAHLRGARPLEAVRIFGHGLGYGERERFGRLPVSNKFVH